MLRQDPVTRIWENILVDGEVETPEELELPETIIKPPKAKAAPVKAAPPIVLDENPWDDEGWEDLNEEELKETKIHANSSSKRP